jgi:hypothetical protein
MPARCGPRRLNWPALKRRMYEKEDLMFTHNPLHEELEKKSSRRPKYMNHYELSRFYQKTDNHQTTTSLKNQLFSTLGDWLISWGCYLKSKSMDQRLTLQLHHQD